MPKSWAFGSLMLGILSMYKSKKLQKWKIFDFMPTLELSVPTVDKSYGHDLSDVIWYHPWDPGKPLFAHVIFSKWMSEIFGSRF